MNKKVIIGIIVFLIVIITILIINKSNSTKNAISSDSEQTKLEKNDTYEWLEDENRYVVYGKDGEIRGYANDKYDLKKFEKDPDLYFESFPDGYFDQKDIIEPN